MTNRNIRLDKSTWEKFGSGGRPGNAFNIHKEEEQKQQQNLLTMNNDDVEYTNVSEQLLRIPHLNVPFEYGVIFKVEDEEHYLRPGFYQRNNFRYNNKALNFPSILIKTDIKVTVLDNELVGIGNI